MKETHVISLGAGVQSTTMLQAILREGKGMIEYCPRCGGELTETPTNHYAKKIKVCERCRKEDLKRLLNISDVSTVYGIDCPSGKCEM